MERTRSTNSTHKNAPCASDKLNKTNALLPTTLVQKVGLHREMVENREREREKRKKETSYHQPQQQQYCGGSKRTASKTLMEEKFMHIRISLLEKEVDKEKKK